MEQTRIVTAAQMRRADQLTIEAGTSGFTLMQRAGQAVTAAVVECMPDYGRIVIVAGPGNNGGDGFAAATVLRQRRIPVTVVTLTACDDLSGDVLAHAEQARAAGVKIREALSGRKPCELGRWLLRAVMIVDAIFGTGLNRPLNERMQGVVAQINGSDRPVFSIDIPSGICADTGFVLGAAVQADFTLPIAATKWGHWLGDGRDYAGRLLPVADIGIGDDAIRAAWTHDCGHASEQPAAGRANEACFCVASAGVIGEAEIAAAWTVRSRTAHKGCYGHVRIFGGSVGFSGAPQLAGLGALAAGAGLVSIVCPDEVWPVIAAGHAEIMVHPESRANWQGADALVIGPGWGRERGELLQQLLNAGASLVIDADALNIIAESEPLQRRLSARSALSVITPHPGEAARLLGVSVAEIQQDRKRAALMLTTRYNCRVVLKGAETLIASPARDLLLNPFGSPQLAVAGSGDVLAGMIGAQLARHDLDAASPDRLIAAAVALHGQAGACGGWYLAGELAGSAAGLRRRIEQGGKRA
jgi:NAD(P)H-hydrate epimerase